MKDKNKAERENKLIKAQSERSKSKEKIQGEKQLSQNLSREILELRIFKTFSNYEALKMRPQKHFRYSHNIWILLERSHLFFFQMLIFCKRGGP